MGEQPLPGFGHGWSSESQVQAGLKGFPCEKQQGHNREVVLLSVYHQLASCHLPPPPQWHWPSLLFSLTMTKKNVLALDIVQGLAHLEAALDLIWHSALGMCLSVHFLYVLVKTELIREHPGWSYWYSWFLFFWNCPPLFLAVAFFFFFHYVLLFDNIIHLTICPLLILLIGNHYF